MGVGMGTGMNKSIISATFALASLIPIPVAIYLYKNNKYNKSVDMQLIDSVYSRSLVDVKKKVGLGANVNFKDERLDTPLGTACSLDDLDIIRFLLENGADPNEPNAEGYTPLMYSCQNVNVDAVKLLIDYGAKPLQITTARRSAMDIAIEYKNNKILDIMHKK